jgi:hypothetical protein
MARAANRRSHAQLKSTPQTAYATIGGGDGQAIWCRGPAEEQPMAQHDRISGSYMTVPSSQSRAASEVRPPPRCGLATSALVSPGAPGPVAHSPALIAARSRCQLYASARSPVIFVGATGTGKSHFARYLHMLSPRARHRFVDVTAAEVDGELARDSLFGHEVGAFTGAVRRRIGLFEEAGNVRCFSMTCISCRWRNRPSCCELSIAACIALSARSETYLLPVAFWWACARIPMSWCKAARCCPTFGIGSGTAS